MKSIFSNSELARQLEVMGYVKLRLISAESCDELIALYKDRFPPAQTFYSSSFHPDFEFKKEFSDIIYSKIKAKINDFFIEYDLLGCNILEKPAHGAAMPLHQDWTVCDESIAHTYTAWVALQDTGREYGALRVIPRSHRAETGIRAPGIPSALDAEREKLDSFQQTVELSKGEAIVFDHRLMHASWPNKQSASRLALTIGLSPEGTSLSLPYLNKSKGLVSFYSMSADIFLRYPELMEEPVSSAPFQQLPFKKASLTKSGLAEVLYSDRKKQSIMQPLFKDPEHQLLFERDGFIKLPALDERELQELTSYLASSGIRGKTEHGFYVGMDHRDKDLVSKMIDRIRSVAIPYVSPYLNNFKSFTASYVIKDSNPVSVVPPHQDWTFVENEELHCSVTCWIPLVDVNKENGCLGLIRGSHRMFDSPRPSPAPQSPSPLNKHMFTLFSYMELVEMKAGEAIFFDNRTIHASPPNISQEDRLAIGLGFTQEDAAIRHYFLKPGTKNTLLKYAVDEAFYERYDNSSLSAMYDRGERISDYALLEEQPYRWEDLSKDELIRRIVDGGGAYNDELSRHMKSLFGAQIRQSAWSMLKKTLSPSGIYHRIKSIYSQ